MKLLLNLLTIPEETANNLLGSSEETDKDLLPKPEETANTEFTDNPR